MNYHGRIVERVKKEWGYGGTYRWSVLSESVILDMVTAFTRLHKSSSHGIQSYRRFHPYRKQTAQLFATGTYTTDGSEQVNP